MRNGLQPRSSPQSGQRTANDPLLVARHERADTPADSDLHSPGVLRQAEGGEVTDAEQKVRAVWMLAQKSKIGGHIWLSSGTNKSYADWSAALAFTEERLEEIRQLREEIEEISGDIETFEDTPSDPVYRRILSRLESILAEKTAGLKQGVYGNE
jgi:hypothetical protein